MCLKNQKIKNAKMLIFKIVCKARHVAGGVAKIKLNFYSLTLFGNFVEKERNQERQNRNHQNSESDFDDLVVIIGENVKV